MVLVLDDICQHINFEGVEPIDSYLRLTDSCIIQLKAQNLLGPVTRVTKKKKDGDNRKHF